jgi:hypothetical protein
MVILRYLSSKSGVPYGISEMNVVAQKADGLNREDYYWICVFVQSSLHSRIAHVKTKVGAVIKYGDCLLLYTKN